jgi:HlyD family secretion protein
MNALRTFKRDRLRFATIVAGVGVASALYAAASRLQRPQEAKTKSQTNRVELVEVNAVRPQRLTLQHLIEQPGQIEGFEQTILYAKIAGFVQAYHVDIGDRVKKGQLLAELWVPELVEDVNQKIATVSQDVALISLAREELRAAEVTVTKMEAMLRLAEASRIRAEANYVRWEAQLGRDSRLLKTQVVTAETYDITVDQLRASQASQGETTAGVSAATAALDESKALRDKFAASVRVAEAHLRISEAERDRASAILGYAKIEAPYDGVVSRRDVDTGAYVQAPGSNNSDAQLLFEVVKTDTLRIFVDIPEVDAAWVRKGDLAQIRVQALGDRVFSGHVARFSWVLENQTRTLRTEIDLQNAEESLRPGMYATVFLPVEHPDVISLPSSAIIALDGQNWIMRVQDGKAERIGVSLGIRNGQQIEVLRQKNRGGKVVKGSAWQLVDESEFVVVDNPSEIEDGQAVHIHPLSSGK